MAGVLTFQPYPDSPACHMTSSCHAATGGKRRVEPKPQAPLSAERLEETEAVKSTSLPGTVGSAEGSAGPTQSGSASLNRAGKIEDALASTATPAAGEAEGMGVSPRSKSFTNGERLSRLGAPINFTLVIRIHEYVMRPRMLPPEK